MPELDPSNPDPEYRRQYCQQALQAAVSNLLIQILKVEGLSKPDLAATIGCTSSKIYKLMAPGRNLTLNNIADLFWAAGYEVKLMAQPLPGGSQPEGD